MTDVKDLLASKTFWGIFLMVAGLFRAPWATAIDSEVIVSTVTIVLEAAGAVLALWGRIKAGKAIGTVAGIKLG